MPDDDGLFLGHGRAVDAVRARNTRHLLPAHHLVTHSVILGMTGSGKTGLVTVVIEEALRNGIPVLAIDVKGALPNLMLAFPTCDAQSFAPFALGTAKLGDERTVDELAEALATERREALEAWGIGEPELQSYADTTSFRLITPGSDAGELLHILSSLEVRSDRWDTDPQSARASLSVAVSLVLRLLGRDPDPAKSRERVLLSILAERRLLAGDHADLATLMDDLAEPPLEEIGALPLDEYLPPGERKTLAQALHSLLASPTFSSWRQGAPLDVAGWMTPRNGRTPAVIVSVAHLDDAERTQVLGVLLEEVLQWVRGLPSAQQLKALVVFDEVYGFLPPHPANPPTKRPIVALMKQARAFGVGAVIATQNPMDLDYRALGNAGVWCIGRLGTDADRERVVDGMVFEPAAEKSIGKLV